MSGEIQRLIKLLKKSSAVDTVCYLAYPSDNGKLFFQLLLLVYIRYGVQILTVISTKYLHKMQII